MLSGEHAQDGDEVVGTHCVDDEPAGIAVLRGQQKGLSVILRSESASCVLQQRSAEIRQLQATTTAAEQFDSMNLF